MIRQGEERRRLVEMTFSVLRRCRDAGEKTVAELPGNPPGRCDLCNAKTPIGRLLVGLEVIEARHRGGALEFRTRPADSLADGSFWVCRVCFRLLKSDQEKLLERVLHDPEKN